ncbi:TPA: hypothetical protein QEL76_001075 [Stenotrophomonas maltophilia]|nr:hypothetical protein [Stenotrophomonas maltophilia]
MTRIASPREILDAAEARRESLASQWLSAAQVNAGLNLKFGRGCHSASELRRHGKLLGVYVTHPIGSYRYPTWQFRPDGQPVERLAKILAVLRDFGPFQREPCGLRRSTGWGEAEWFLSPHVLLWGAVPAAMLSVDPARVLHAVQCEFEEDV